MTIEIVNKKNYEASEKLKEVIRKKVGKLDKYFDDTKVVKVLLKKENDECNMEICVQYDKSFMRAAVGGENMFDIIDIVLPKFERQILKHRSKLQQKVKANAFKEAPLYLKSVPEEKETKIARVKEFDMFPMSVTEAAEELDLLGHDFYVFLDEKTELISVIYHRDDGDYGLIRPKV